MKRMIKRGYVLTTTKTTCFNNNCAQNNTLGARGCGVTTDCTELHRNEGITMKTMRGSPNSIRGNGQRKTRGVAASTKPTGGEKEDTADHRHEQNSQV